MAMFNAITHRTDNLLIDHTDHLNDLDYVDHLDPVRICCHHVLCRIRVADIQPRKHVLPGGSFISSGFHRAT